MFKQQEKIYNKAVELVCEECGITADDLRCGRNRIAADARFILVRIIAPYVCDDDFDYSQGSKIWHYMAI